MSERDMQDLLDLLERTLGKSWVDLSAWLRSQNKLEDIEAMLQVGDFSAITESIREAAAKFATDTLAGFTTAGTRAAAWLNGEVDSLVHFDVVNASAVRWAQANKLDLVTGIAAEQRATMNQVLVAGARSSINPRVVARELRDGLGLTPVQQDWLTSYRRALEQSDFGNALGRELSHGASDRTIAAAARAGRALTGDQVDLAVERYRANIVSYRAENIARTEGLRVAHQGVEESLQQAVRRGDVEADSLIREWNTAHDPRVRSSHRAMNGQKRKLGEPFESGAGMKLRYPGDPQAPVAEVAQCRCAVGTRYRPSAAARAA